jgi:hypothetical protein
MPNDRLIQAIGRMERALTRLENVDLRASAPGSEPSDLQQRHERLKADTRAALSEIDGLIAGLER